MKSISTFQYIAQVANFLPEYETFYADNGDFDNAAMLRHFATAIVAYSVSEEGSPAYNYAVSDITDLLPTIKQLVHENEKGEPQPLVLTEVKELSAPESIDLVLNITLNLIEAPAVKVFKDAICSATARAKAVAYKLRLAAKIKQIAGQEASNAFLAGAL